MPSSHRVRLNVRTSINRSVRPLSSRLLIAVSVILGLGLAAPDGTGAKDDPPVGFHWQPIVELKARLAIPDGWRVTTVSTGDPFVLQVTPAGPHVRSSASLFQLEVKRHTDTADVDVRAYAFVKSTLVGTVTDGHIKIKPLGVIYFYSCSGVQLDASEGWPKTAIAAIAAANRRTGTLYTMTFTVPYGEDWVGFLGPMLLEVSVR